MPQENVDVVRSSIAAFSQGDFDGVQELNHQEVELDWSESRGLEAGVYKGEKEVMRFYETLADMFDRIEIEPERFIESGDLVVVPHSARFRGRDGVETFARSTLLFEVRSGRIARIRLF